MDAIIFGNVTLDVICYPVNDVPRNESINFEDVMVSPGGCASNTAIGLASLGIPTGIVARTGDDDSADLLFRYWQRVGVDPFFVRKTPGVPTGIAVGLIDDHYQPRFIHTSGANRGLTAEVLDPKAYAEQGVKFFHIAGFFVLPNLFSQVADKLAQLGKFGITTSLDVVFNVRMEDPKLRDALWVSLPHLDYFLANDYEATRLTGESNYHNAAAVLRARGARSVIIKLGEKGCFAFSDIFTGIVPATKVNVVDTTGAGDAFAAGFMAGLLHGSNLRDACLAGNRAGAKVCTRLGAIAAWVDRSNNNT